jgi:hypothetical protein
MIYATTPEFLEVFGLKDLDSLPDLKEFQEIERARIEAESEGVETITEMRPHEAAEGENEAVVDEASSDEASEGPIAEESIESREEKS